MKRVVLRESIIEERGRQRDRNSGHLHGTKENSMGVQVKKRLMLGNEAIAWGAIAAGIDLAAGYPGTPSSEVIQTLVNLAPEYGHYVEWSTNEKVAVECAAAAAWAGLRAMAVMKHLGLNVAADTLATLAYTGVRGGMVILSAGDAQCHTSSNEQDSRLFARFVKLPILDPSDPAEGFSYTKMAFEISERLELPVIVNSTPRLSHTSQAVELEPIERQRHRKAQFLEDKDRWICVAAAALRRHRWLNSRLAESRARLSGFPLVRRLYSGRRLGIITNGVAHNYVLEAVDQLGLRREVSILKIGMSFPFPEDEVAAFAREVQRILVVEELEPFVEEQTCLTLYRRDIHTPVKGKGLVPREGELTPDVVIAAIETALNIKRPKEPSETVSLPQRPLLFCPGCPHRATYYALRQALRRLSKRPLILGDIGCYTLATSYPFELLDTLLCMGSGVGMAHGFAKAGLDRPILAVIGDSTLFHSGLSPLANITYNRSNVTVLVLDNSYTAMTGAQPNPSTGYTAVGEEVARISIQEVAHALGFEYIKEVDAYDVKTVEEALVEAVSHVGPSMVISRRPCALQVQRLERKKGISLKSLPKVDSEACIGCRTCLTAFGCPAIKWDEERGKAFIDQNRCTACGVCTKVCPVGAIKAEEGQE